MDDMGYQAGTRSNYGASILHTSISQVILSCSYENSVKKRMWDLSFQVKHKASLWKTVQLSIA